MNQEYLKKRNGELVIDFKEYFWRLLEQWKAVLIFSLIVVLLLSGVTYDRAGSFEKAEETDKHDIASQHDGKALDALSPNDQKVVLSAVEEKNSLDALGDYVSTSPFMTLDPNRVNTLMVYLLLESDEDNSRALSIAYTLELTSSQIAGAVNDAWGDAYRDEQVAEMIGAVSGVPLESDSKFEDNIIQLKLYVPDDMDPKLAESAIKDSLSSIKEKLSASFGDHDVIIISSDVQIISDKDLSDRQYDVYSRLYNLTNQSNYLTGIMSAEQKSAYSALLDDKDENADGEEQSEPAQLNNFFKKKNVILGIAFAFLTYAFIYLLIFALKNRVSSASGLECIFNLRVLGEWYPNYKNGIAGFLFYDSRVYKLHHRGHLSIDSEATKAGESIVFALNDRGKDNLLIVSSEKAGEKTKAFFEVLEAYLKDKGIIVTLIEINGLRGVSLSENTISNTDSCVLIVDGKETIKNEIDDVINKCNFCNVPLIGAIYIG